MISFLGSIGHIMANTGLREVLEVEFAENAVTYMMNGKSVSIAIRGHFLVEAMLTKLLLNQTFGEPGHDTNVYFQLVEELFIQVLKKQIPLSSVENHHVITTIHTLFTLSLSQSWRHCIQGMPTSAWPAAEVATSECVG